MGILRVSYRYFVHSSPWMALGWVIYYLTTATDPDGSPSTWESGPSQSSSKRSRAARPRSRRPPNAQKPRTLCQAFLPSNGNNSWADRQSKRPSIQNQANLGAAKPTSAFEHQSMKRRSIGSASFNSPGGLTLYRRHGVRLATSSLTEPGH